MSMRDVNATGGGHSDAPFGVGLLVDEEMASKRDENGRSRDSSVSLAEVIEDRFVRELNMDFICPICQGVLKNPHMNTEPECSHTFCYNCIRTWQGKSLERNEGEASCPNCRRSIKDLVFNRSLDNIIKRMDVYCRNDGCSWTGPYAEIDTHDQICAFKLVNCKNEGCEELVMRSKLNEHVPACPYKHVVCPNCTNYVVRKNLEVHLTECGMGPIPCPFGCPLLIPRDATDAHREICGEVLVDCPIAGCGERMKRRFVERHVESGGHLVLVNRNLERRIESLENHIVQFFESLSLSEAKAGTKGEVKLSSLLSAMEKFKSERVLPHKDKAQKKRVMDLIGRKVKLTKDQEHLKNEYLKWNKRAVPGKIVSKMGSDGVIKGTNKDNTIFLIDFSVTDAVFETDTTFQLPGSVLHSRDVEDHSNDALDANSEVRIDARLIGSEERSDSVILEIGESRVRLPRRDLVSSSPQSSTKSESRHEKAERGEKSTYKRLKKFVDTNINTLNWKVLQKQRAGQPQGSEQLSEPGLEVETLPRRRMLDVKDMKIGTRLKVLEDIQYVRRVCHDSRCGWNETVMRKFIGAVGIVVDNNDGLDVELKFQNDPQRWWFPLETLEPA